MQRHFIMFIEFNFCLRIARVHSLEKTLYIPVLQFNRWRHHYRKCCDTLCILGVCVAVLLLVCFETGFHVTQASPKLAT